MTYSELPKIYRELVELNVELQGKTERLDDGEEDVSRLFAWSNSKHFDGSNMDSGFFSDCYKVECVSQLPDLIRDKNLHPKKE